jgi:hypothetical protein
MEFANTIEIDRPAQYVFRFLAAPLAAGRIREAVAENLATLKELMESS